MKLKSNIITFLMLFCATVVAQNNFYDSYNLNNGDDFGLILIEFNSSYYIFGTKTGGTRGAKFLKLDSLGNSSQHKNLSYVSNPSFRGGVQFGKNFIGYGAQFDPIEGAADSYLLELNVNGDTIKTIPSDFAFNDRIDDAVLKSDSTLVVFGFFTDSTGVDKIPYLANIDTSGNVLWFKTHNNPTGLPETITNMVATNDGGYVFAGEEFETSQGWLDKFLYKVDSLGDFVWKKTYHEPLTQRGRKVTYTKDGNFLFCGTGYAAHSAQRSIIKADSNGNIIWEKKFGTTQYHEDFHKAIELPNKNIICAGSSIRLYNNIEVADINLTLLDSVGNLIWSKDYTYHGLDYEDYVRDLIVTSDGGFAMTGFILNAPGGTGNDVFVLKTDGNGLITSTNSGFYEVTPEMKVYPNPTTGIVNVPYIEGLERIEVYDIKGTSTPLGNLQNLDFEQSREAQIDLTNQTKGTYIFKFYMKNGEVKSTKIIKN